MVSGKRLDCVRSAQGNFSPLSVQKFVVGIVEQKRCDLHLESTARKQLPFHPRPPLPVPFLIAMIAHAINERIARKMEYMPEEIRVLK